MIISASRRTDIPAFYSEWFLSRLRDRYVYVRNPMNARQISKVDLSVKFVDCIVFWTKNPFPMLDRLSVLDQMGYPYYFQFTLNPYDHNIERNLPEKPRLVDTFES